METLTFPPKWFADFAARKKVFQAVCILSVYLTLNIEKFMNLKSGRL